MERENKTHVYAAKLKDKERLKASSSGGAFVALSDSFLRQGWAIVCASYNYELHKMEYVLIEDAAKRDQARGSKYVQSQPGNIFRESKAWLEQNPQKKILFVGTGCQADGFDRYISAVGLRHRTVIVDLICHGSPSPKLWQDYMHLMAGRYGKVQLVSFKDKRNGWKHPTAFVQTEDGEHSISEYVNIFYDRCALRPACHECPYATVERKTDLTIGDFWGIENVMPEFYDTLGVSLVLTHTAEGENLLENSRAELELRETTVENCLQPNLIRPTKCSRRRKRFWRDYRQHGIEAITKKYGTMRLSFKIVSALKRRTEKLKRMLIN